MKKIEVMGLQGIGEIQRGDDLPQIIIDAAQAEGVGIGEKDVIVVTSKIVSKAMGLVVEIDSIKPSARALRLGEKTGKDPRLVQMIWNMGHEILGMVPVSGVVFDSIMQGTRHVEDSKALCRKEGAMCITRDPQGRIYTHESGIDGSNHPHGIVSVPPPDPDEAALAIREQIGADTGKNVAVVIADTELVGAGTLDVAIGSSGINPRPNLFGQADSFGKPKFGGLDIVSHELTCAAALLFGQLTNAICACIIRGYQYEFNETANIANTLWAHTGDGQMKRLLRDSIRCTGHLKPWPKRLIMHIASKLI